MSEVIGGVFLLGASRGQTEDRPQEERVSGQRNQMCEVGCKQECRVFLGSETKAIDPMT